MSKWIAMRIIEAAKSDMAAGQEKYNSYFSMKKLIKYKNETDRILADEGYQDCIKEA